MGLECYKNIRDMEMRGMNLGHTLSGNRALVQRGERRGVARCFFKWHWNRTWLEESSTRLWRERFSGGQCGSWFLGICFHHTTFKVTKEFCCTTCNGLSEKGILSVKLQRCQY